ncbi:hypothetical protein Hamer_G023148 [Homarus americanus]|uniref:Uncharacterized protein n=1 Tax=Homarus americanus TaxID=6706 RepID=A0A8J5K5S5_HOMAM|nr:hypothetical protein Hamer_G023148 [Homarus americanus]
MSEGKELVAYPCSIRNQTLGYFTHQHSHSGSILSHLATASPRVPVSNDNYLFCYLYKMVMSSKGSPEMSVSPPHHLILY